MAMVVFQVSTRHGKRRLADASRTRKARRPRFVATLRNLHLVIDHKTKYGKVFAMCLWICIVYGNHIQCDETRERPLKIESQGRLSDGSDSLQYLNFILRIHLALTMFSRTPPDYRSHLT